MLMQALAEMFGITFAPAAWIGCETMLVELAEPVVNDIAKKLAGSAERQRGQASLFRSFPIQDDAHFFVVCR
jgi:hypothetical protein